MSVRRCLGAHADSPAVAAGSPGAVGAAFVTAGVPVALSALVGLGLGLAPRRTAGPE